MGVSPRDALFLIRVHRAGIDAREKLLWPSRAAHPHHPGSSPAGFVTRSEHVVRIAKLHVGAGQSGIYGARVAAVGILLQEVFARGGDHFTVGGIEFVKLFKSSVFGGVNRRPVVRGVAGAACVPCPACPCCCCGGVC